MKNPITWFEVYVDDMLRASAFYSSVFAIEFTDLLDPTDPSDSALQMKAFPSDMESHGASGALVCVDGMLMMNTTEWADAMIAMLSFALSVLT